ncbi:MAG: hypothetical protein ACRDA3_07420 [Peptostreptococcaceae bacterium]
MQQIFKDNIKDLALKNNNVKGFNEYAFGENKYIIVLPEKWSLEERLEDVNGDGLEVNFTDNYSIKGSIEVLNEVSKNEYISQALKKSINDIKTSNYRYNDEEWIVYKYDTKKLGRDFENIIYLKEYSEEKLLIVNFEVEQNKYKPSINVVFDEIALRCK